MTFYKLKVGHYKGVLIHDKRVIIHDTWQPCYQSAEHLNVPTDATNQPASEQPRNQNLSANDTPTNQIKSLPTWAAIGWAHLVGHFIGHLVGDQPSGSLDGSAVYFRCIWFYCLHPKVPHFRNFRPILYNIYVVDQPTTPMPF